MAVNTEMLVRMVLAIILIVAYIDASATTSTPLAWESSEAKMIFRSYEGAFPVYEYAENISSYGGFAQGLQKIAEHFEDEIQVKPQYLLNNDIHPLFRREAWVMP